MLLWPLPWLVFLLLLILLLSFPTTTATTTTTTSSSSCCFYFFWCWDFNISKVDNSDVFQFASWLFWYYWRYTDDWKESHLCKACLGTLLNVSTITVWCHLPVCCSITRWATHRDHSPVVPGERVSRHKPIPRKRTWSLKIEACTRSRLFNLGPIPSCDEAFKPNHSVGATH